MKNIIAESVIFEQFKDIKLELDSLRNSLIEQISMLIERNTELELDKEIRAFAALKDTRSDEENAEILRTLLNKHLDKMKSAEKTFYTTITKFLPKKGSSQQFKFLYQIKTVDSIIDKVIKRNKKLLDISDLIRGAILFKDKQEMAEFIDDFRRKGGSFIKGYDFKAKGSDTDFGYYGSHHFDLHMDGFNVELQVMPAKLWKYKESAHQIYSKWRAKPESTPEIDKALSRKLFNIGNTNEAFNYDDLPILY